jgi:hypothetical protein
MGVIRHDSLFFGHATFSRFFCALPRFGLDFYVGGVSTLNYVAGGNTFHTKKKLFKQGSP